MKMKLLLEISPEHMIVSRVRFPESLLSQKRRRHSPLTKAGTGTKMIDVRFRRGKLECRKFGSKSLRSSHLIFSSSHWGREQKGKT